jgi:hypothetical protein
MIVDHRNYAMFDYNQNPSKDDKFILGEVVTNEENEIGVIIQCHGNNEYRTDMFGNCCFHKDYGDIRKATLLNILMNRPTLKD